MMAENIRSKDRDSDLDPELQEAVTSICAEPLDEAAISRIKANAKNLPVSAVSPRRSQLPGRIPRMWVALAATVLLAVGATTLFPTTPKAFGEVMKQIRSSGAFRYVTLVYTDQADEVIESKVFVSEDGRQRRELLHTISIHDATGRIRLTMLEGQKMAMVRDGNEGGDAESTKYDMLGWIEHLRSHSGKPEKRLASKELEGRTVEGFVVKSGPHEFTLWIDASANELVQMEHGPLVEGSAIEKVVMKDFHFGESFDESLFSFEPPAGYQRRQSPKMPAEISGGEASIVAALRGYTKVSGGTFPDSITNWGDWAVLFSQSGVESDEITQVMSHLGAILPFLTSRSSDDYEYLGKGQSTDGERAIVFWWRNDEGTIRAVYSNFEVAELGVDELPQAP